MTYGSMIDVSTVRVSPATSVVPPLLGIGRSALVEIISEIDGYKYEWSLAPIAFHTSLKPKLCSWSVGQSLMFATSHTNCATELYFPVASINAPAAH